MTMIPNEIPAKKKQSIHAELNFVAEHSLEELTHQIQSMRSKTITAEVMAMDEDTALFVLTIDRNEQATAELQGRLQRWAGDMTHVYCDATTKNSLKRRIFDLNTWNKLLTASIPMLLLALIVSIVYSSAFFISVGIVFAAIAYFPILKLLDRTLHLDLFPRRRLISQAERDREYLLDRLVEIIRDDDIHEHLSRSTPESRPLTDEATGVDFHSVSRAK